MSIGDAEVRECHNRIVAGREPRACVCCGQQCRPDIISCRKQNHDANPKEYNPRNALPELEPAPDIERPHPPSALPMSLQLVEVGLIGNCPLKQSVANTRIGTPKSLEFTPHPCGVPVSVEHICAAEIRVAEVGPTEPRVYEVRVTQVRDAKVCFGEVRPFEVCPTKVRVIEYRASEIRMA